MEFEQFRARARTLLAQGVPPSKAHWTDDLYAVAPAEAGIQSSPTPSTPLSSGVTVPPGFIELCETVALHRDEQRHDLMYRLLWRLRHEPQLRHDPLDADMLLARRMAHAVRRDMHKMRAFVRFREAGGMHVAWYEPDNRIVRANAPWFRRRFAQMRWAILSPECSVQWDGEALHYAAGARREDAPPPDAGEALWLTYYRSIFNPARLKLDAMRKEMPRRYWKNLPEAALIAPLAAQATARAGRMVDAPPPEPARRIPLYEGPATFRGGLPALAQAMQRCRECPLGAHATQAVAGSGPADAQLMLVGEQPGDQEDVAGEPFVGPAGQLLRRAMLQAGLTPEEAFLTNAVRHFKFELRGRRRIHKTPAQREVAACAHWLEAEVALVQPRRIVALGATAGRSLLGRAVAVASERGAWQRRSDGREVLVTWHPSALLRMPPAEREAAFEQFVHDLTLARAG